jgi:hypothetical protein
MNTRRPQPGQLGTIKHRQLCRPSDFGFALRLVRVHSPLGHGLLTVDMDQFWRRQP